MLVQSGEIYETYHLGIEEVYEDVIGQEVAKFVGILLGVPLEFLTIRVSEMFRKFPSFS